MMHHTGGIHVGGSAGTVSVKIASSLGTLLENVLMWQFVITADFLGTLLQNAPRNPYVGTVESLVIWLTVAPMRASATPVVKRGIVHGSALHQHCLLVT